jgi:outer membrane immunogenic protein
MKKLLIAGATLAALIGTPALAADLALKAPPPPPAPVFSWTGFYIGADIGGATEHQNANTLNPTLNALFNQAPDFVTLNSTSAMGGVYAGANYQFNSVVVGIEGDWSASHFSASALGPNNFNTTGLPVGSGGVSFARTESWVASLRGRLGFTPAPMVLLYVTGGGAWTNIGYSGVNAFAGGCPNCGVMSTSSSNQGGWAAGGGAEWAATAHWILRAEYLHYQFNGQSATVSFVNFPAIPCCTYNFGRTNIDEGRVGVAYKF